MLSNIVTLVVGIYIAELLMYTTKNLAAYWAMKRYYRKQDEILGKMVRPLPKIRPMEEDEEDKFTVN